MARIAFKHTPDSELNFVDIQSGYLINVCYEFARTFDDESIYTAIVGKKIRIEVNDKIIPVDDWHITEIKDSDKIVIYPSIGKDSGLLMVGIGILLIVVAPYLPAGYIVAGAQLTYAGLATSIGISFILGGISQMLFQPDLPNLPSISSSKQTQTYSWTGIKTTAQIDTPIPIVYGTHPVGGNVISLFVENSGGNSYLNMLLALCEGEIEGICQEYDHTSICTTSDKRDSNYKSPAITIEDQPLRFYDDVQWWYRKGTNLEGGSSQYDPNYQNIIPNFDGAKLQYDDGREVTAAPDYLEYVTTKPVDNAIFNFFVPQLYNAEGSDIIDEAVSFKLQYSTDGNTFYNYEGSGTYTYQATVSGDHSQFCSVKYKNSDYKYSYPEPTYIIRVVSNELWPYYNPTLYGAYFIKIDILDEDYNLVESKSLRGTIRYTETYVGGGEGNEQFERHTIYTEPEQFYIGEYLVTLNHNIIAGDEFTISSTNITSQVTPIITIKGKTKTGIYASIRIDFTESGMPGNGIYYIRTTRTDGGKSDSLKVADNLILQSVIEVVNGEFIYPKTALLGFRIKATGQLSGSPPNVITILKGTKVEVPDLSGSETFQNVFWDDTDNRWEYNDAERTWDNITYQSTKEYSNNSMLCVRDLFLSEIYGLGEYYSSSDFDTSEIVTTIRECWKRYNPYSGEDYFKWWDSGKNSDWRNYWKSINSTNLTWAYNSSTRSITITGTGKYTTDNPSKGYFKLYLTPITSLKVGQSYDLSITISNVNYPVNIDIYGTDKNFYWSPPVKLNTLSNKTDGTHTSTITVVKKFDYILLYVYGITGSSSYIISDVSLVKGTNSYEHYHTWNGVIESGQSALTVLLEMCDVFRCWPVWHSGKINFVSDTNKTQTQTLSVGNTEKFSQSFTPLSQIPYRIIGQFTDEARNYNMRALVSRTTVPGIPKINETTIGLKGITSKAKAERELKFKHGKVALATHSIGLTCGIDILHGTAGDIIGVQDDLPQWGHGGNIISYTATNFTIDTPYDFSNVATYVFTINYQGIDNSQLTATIDTTNIVTNDSLQTFPMINIPASPCEQSVFNLNTTDYQYKQFKIISTGRSDEDKIEIGAIEHISALYTSEPSLTIIKDHTSNLKPSNPNMIPHAPINLSAVPLQPSEGMGFALSARPNPEDYGVTEIVVQLDRNNTREFETIGSLFAPYWSTTYSDASLKFNYSYRFRFFCKTANKTGLPAEITATIPGNALAIQPPKGLRIKGQTLNSNQFDDKDVTIIWDSVGLSTDLNYSIKGYKINVYRNSIDKSNLLRTDFKSSEEYTYTYAMNVGDNGVANGILVFELTTLTTNGWESPKSSFITVTNSTPNAPTGLSTTSWMRGVKFSWNKNSETDLAYYSYRTRGLTGTLGFDGDTGTFTAGNTIYGATSGASATIDMVGVGVLYLSSISGTFQDNEIIYESSYGSELVTNGSFTTDTNWTKGTGWSIAAGVANCSGAQTAVADLYQINVTTSGNFYKLVGTISNFVDGLIWFGGSTVGTTFNSDGTKTAYIQANDTTLYFTGNISFEADIDDVSCKQITNAAFANGVVTYDSWSDWKNITNTEVSRFIESPEEPYGNEVTIAIQIKAVDLYGNESEVSSAQDITLGLNIQSTDIDSFAITSSKIFNKIPVLEGDAWLDHTVNASDVQWNQHNLYYNGTLCVIASGHTSDKYIYWKNLDTSYSTSASHPADLASPNQLHDDDFIIAVNVDGVHDLAWNAIANQVIGSAYIQYAAIMSAHIADAQIHTAHIASLAVVNGHIDNMSGDKILLTSNLCINATTFGTTGLQVKYNLGQPKFFFGDPNTSYLSIDTSTGNGIFKGDLYVIGGEGKGGFNLIRNGDWGKDSSGTHDPTDWTLSLNGTPLAYQVWEPNPSTYWTPWDPNGLVYYVNCNQSSEYVRLVGDDYIPIDNTKHYCLSAYVRGYSGTRRVYIGLFYYDAAFTQITYNYPCLNNYSPPTNWSQYSGIIYPVGSEDPYSFVASCAYVKPIIFPQYQAIGGNFISRVQLVEGLAPITWPTMDGGSIYANSITADKIEANSITATQISANSITANEIRGSDFGTLTLSSGKIIINASNGLDVNSGYGIKITGNDLSPAYIYMYGSTYNTKMGCNTAGNVFEIMPNSSDNISFRIGYNDTGLFNGTRTTFTQGQIACEDKFEVIVGNDGILGDYTKIMLQTDQSTYSRIWLYSIIDTGAAICLEDKVGSPIYFGPQVDQSCNLARSTCAWDSVYAYDFSDVGDFYQMDTFDDLAELHKIKGSGKFNEEGLELINDDTLPEFLLKKNKDGNIEYNPDYKPYISIKKAISHLWGCVRQLDNKLEDFTASLNKKK